MDLAKYARQNRYRVRNLHDGEPVPPARRRKSNGRRVAYVSATDRLDVIVGYDGYLVDEGEPCRLGVYMTFKSARGVKRTQARLEAMGGTVKQVGDIEIAGTVPVERIEDALKLIRVSKLPPGASAKRMKAVRAAMNPCTRPAREPESLETIETAR